MRKRVVIPSEVTKDADALIQRMRESSPEECVSIEYKRGKGIPFGKFISSPIGEKILEEF